MKRWRQLAVLGAVAGCCAAVAGGRAPRAVSAYAGGNGMIAYQHRVPGFANGWSLETINPDGSGGTTLLPDGANRVWSPDGNKILFNRFPSFGSADIYVMNADGTGEQQLTSGFPAWSATWSPDGTRIVYERSSPANIADGEIWTMHADGSNNTQITFDGVAKWSPSWAMTPAGSKISFISAGKSGYFTLLTVNADGTGVTELDGFGTDLAWHIIGYDWSPDGTKIALSSYLDTPTGCNGVNVTATDIYVYDVAAKTVTNITNTPAFEGPHEQYPVWSPDGTKIAYSALGTACPNGAFRFTPSSIYTMNAAGGGAVKLTFPELTGTEFGNVQTDDYAPSWQPCRVGTSRCISVASPKAQTIDFGPIAKHTYGDADFVVSATATSGLTVAFSATGGCILNGVTIHLTAAGSCTVTAAQAGNTRYAAAPRVSQTFPIARAVQTISFDSLPSRESGDPDFTVRAHASSGLPVSFSASGHCTVAGARVHVTGTGSCTIRAFQPGNANFEPARDALQTFLITGAAARPSAHCRVPRVTGIVLGAAKAAIRSHHCRTGKVMYAHSRSRKKEVVIAQSRAPGSVLPANSKIALVVSLGRKR